jgi:hypothetical protein
VCFSPVIPALKRLEAEGSQVWDQLGLHSGETLPQKKKKVHPYKIFKLKCFHYCPQTLTSLVITSQPRQIRKTCLHFFLSNYWKLIYRISSLCKRRRDSPLLFFKLRWFFFWRYWGLNSGLPPVLFCEGIFPSHSLAELFACTAFEPRSSWSLPPNYRCEPAASSNNYLLAREKLP